MCQGRNIDFILSTIAERLTQKVSSVFPGVQLPPKKAQSASTEHPAYHRDLSVGGRDTGDIEAVEKSDIDK